MVRAGQVVENGQNTDVSDGLSVAVLTIERFAWPGSYSTPDVARWV